MTVLIKLARLLVPIEADSENFEEGVKRSKGLVSGFASSMTAAGKTVATGIGAGLAAGAAGAVAMGGALVKLAADAAPLQNVKDAFDGIAESAGIGGEAMIEAFDKATAGLVDHESAMMSFNKAAQLVGEDFAVQLPDAMQYLGKVSAATGQDMGFMLDSLVTGVGRLSPMILDNLGIQVTLAEATEKAAEMYGVEADALTKAQQQAGMMSVVLEKLQKNTASMPDITESAAAQMERFKITMKNTKEQIGMALLPALQSLGMLANNLAERFLPPLIKFFEDKIVPAVEIVSYLFGEVFVGALLAGRNPIDALATELEDMGFGEFVEGFRNVISTIQSFIAKAQEVLAPIIEWVSKNVELKDVLIALGIIVGAVLVSALVSFIAAAAPVIAVVVGLIAIVAGLRAAWENDFLGIRTFIEETLAKIREWWAAHGEEVIAKAKEIWVTVKEAISTAIATIKEIISTVLAFVKDLWDKHGDTILATVKKLWDGVVATFNWFKDLFKNLFDAFRMAREGDWSGFGAKLREIWDEVWAKIKEILIAAWEAIQRIIADLIIKIIAKFKSTDWGGLGRSIIQGIIEGIKRGVGALIDAVKAAAKAALDAAKAFLGIDSPSKVFAMEVALPSIKGWVGGLRNGISKIKSASMDLAAASVQGASVTLPEFSSTPAMAGVVVHNHFGVDSVRSEADIYRLAEEIERSINLRSVRRLLP